MCGLSGWFDLQDGAAEPPPAAARRASLDALAARGPDGEGSYVAPDGRVGLLHRRLAIVDVEGGAQPMAGPRADDVLAWNGELFDHRERRRALAESGRPLRTRSDTEVLAHELADRGVEALDGLCAQYALAWVSGASGERRGERRLLLARDPQGEKPLYWCVDGRRLFFASTLDALRALAPGTREIDRDALALYLSWGFVPAPRTIWRGVAKLGAGEWLRAREGVPLEHGRSAARPPGEPPRVIDGGDEVQALRDALRRAARLRLESADVPVGLFLSSGLDSVAVATVLRDVPGLRTFTVRSRDPSLDESAAAAETARALGVPHQVIEPPADDPDAWRTAFLRHGEPFGSSSAVAVDAVARAAGEHVKVVLTGDGGDEALGGYPRHVWLRRLARLPRIPGWARPSEGSRARRLRRAARLLALSPADRYAAMYEVFGSRRASLTPGDRGDAARDIVRELWGDADAGDLAAMLRVDRALELPDSHCVKVDVACMGNGVEARSPWLDGDVVALCDALPRGSRMRRGTTKVVLRELLRRDLPAEPARRLLARRKRGFTTGAAAALGSPSVRDLLSGPLERVPGVRPAAAVGIWEEHVRGEGNHSFRLSVLVALALFADAHLS